MVNVKEIINAKRIYELIAEINTFNIILIETQKSNDLMHKEIKKAIKAFEDFEPERGLDILKDLL